MQKRAGELDRLATRLEHALGAADEQEVEAARDAVRERTNILYVWLGYVFVPEGLLEALPRTFISRENTLATIEVLRAAAHAYRQACQPGSEIQALLRI